jgi:hypothetical protein
VPPTATARLVVALIGAIVFGAGLQWGTFVAGGSDSYCYLHQAERWASLNLQVPEPLALEAPWPAAPLSFAPAGHIPSPTVPGAIVPICPPGLSILMAPFLAVAGPGGAFLVVPLLGVLLVASVYVIGSRFGRHIGVASSALVAVSPVFLFQLMQPMSDVPAAALWMLAVACATSARGGSIPGSGLATSLALLIRPNLLPLGMVIGLFILLRPNRAWRERLRDGSVYAAWSAPGCLALAAIHQMFYGSPLGSGYGPLESLFAVSNVGANSTRYLTWLWQTHTPLLGLALAAPALLPGALTSLSWALVVVNILCYLPYAIFEEWWYLRFLLPTIPLLVVLTVAVIDALCRRFRVRAATAVVAVLTLLWVIALGREAGDRGVFDLRRLEARYARAGEFVARRLPRNALIVTSWESGSVRFYSGRRTLVWDGLDPGWLDEALAFLRERGLEPYLLFERWEEPLFRARFVPSAVATLDWPPMAEVAGQVRVYSPRDRDRYLRGLDVATEFAR